MNESEFPFERPTTPLNVGLSLLTCLPNLEPIRQEELNQWKEEAFRVFESFPGAERVLPLVQEKVPWILGGKAPENSWFGEVRGEKAPGIWVFTDSLTSRLSGSLREWSGQSGVDHLLGHVFAFHAGSKDWGEAVACYYQWRAAHERPWPGVAAAVQVLEKLHKGIPFSNYEREPNF